MEFSSVNTIWVLLGTALVFFMQAGFAMVETGFTRAKNAGNIIMKNLMDFSIGAPVFWIIGFGIMFGSGNGFFGTIDFLTRGDYTSILPKGVPFFAFLIFQTVFCATAATIVSGAMAERTKFISYCVYSLVISLVVYPISGHWIRGGGWLSQLGFHDFAGSTAVHAVYIGTSALLALGCHLCRNCQSGKCNWGIATQNPELVKRLNPDLGKERLVNLLTAWNHEIKEIMGGMGINSIESLRGNRLMLRGIGLNEKELEILSIKHAGE